MTSENTSEFNLEPKNQQKRAIRPKLLKLTDEQVPNNRNRKKNKFKVNKQKENQVKYKLKQTFFRKAKRSETFLSTILY